MTHDANQIPTAGQQSGNSGAPRGKRHRRSMLAIDEREHIIAFAQTRTGRFFIVALFTGLLAGAMAIDHSNAWCKQILITILICGSAATCAYWPQRRDLVIFLASNAVLLSSPCWFPLDGIRAAMLQEHIGLLSVQTFAYIALIGFMLGAWYAMEFARRQKMRFIARRPVLTLLMTEVILCGLACTPAIHGLPRVLLWSFLTVFNAYIWFLCYALIDQRARDCSPPLFQLGIFHPFWGSSAVPYGKGAAFLRKTQSKTPRELAITQIKAIKLLLWALVLASMKTGLIWLFQSKLKMPDLPSVQAAYFLHHPFPVSIGWGALILDTALITLSFAVYFHKTVALARLAGFRLPRSMYRPLEARTLAEFWNRYYYYFKELLVEFFFIPTFLRTFRNHPRLRMFFSTFMAAGVGNAIYHFIRDIDRVATIGLQETIKAYTSYLFYCTVLATGIGLSQLRTNMGARPPETIPGKLLAFLWVWSFVVCLHIFGNETYVYTLGQRIAFMAHLFGVTG